MSFFDIYAKIDKPDVTKCDEKNMHISDKWLINRTNEFIEYTKNAYEKSEFSNVASEFEKFIDELSNWYIRINRKRFWKSENDSDKANAFYSLFNAIKVITAVMAPIIPFITEFTWQNTIKNYLKNAEESVHLADFPVGVGVLDNPDICDLTQKVNLIRELTTLGLNARNSVNIKVKQPIGKMYIMNIKELDKEMEVILKDELNIKEIELIENEENFKKASLAVDFKKAGAILKQKANVVKEYLQKLDEKTMQKYVAQYDNNDIINIMELEVPKEAFTKNLTVKEQYSKAEANGITIIIDKTITPELLEEGIARELVRGCQLLRQEADFRVEQKIDICILSNNELMQKIITKFKDYIEKETLSKFVNDIKDVKIEKEIEVNELKTIVKMG